MYRFGEKVARFKCAHDDKTNPLKSRQYFRQHELSGPDCRVKKRGHLLLKNVCESEWPFLGTSREERTPCAFVCFSKALGVIVIGNVIIHEFVNLSQTHTRAYREKCHTHTHDATGAYATGAYEVRLIRNGDCSPGIPKNYHWGSLRSSNHFLRGVACA